VGQQLVVGHRQRVEEELLAGRVRAQRVAQQGVFRRLVEGDPFADAVTEAGGHEGGVLGEPLGRVPVQPVEGHREIPVEEGRHGPYARRAQFVDQAVVEVEAAGGVHPRPGDREAVRVHAEVAKECDVLGVAVVVVAGHGGRRAVLHPARFGREGVPDRWVALVRRALDLVGRGRDSPEEAVRELGYRVRRHARDHPYRG
jgi:hypothetical protein